MKSEGPVLGLRSSARFANRPSSELDAIAYSSPERRRSCRLLGHSLVFADLNLKEPKFCPQCVAEKGFIEGHWDLRLMTGCPIHRQSLLSTCPKCGDPVRWLGEDCWNANVELIWMATNRPYPWPRRASLALFETEHFTSPLLQKILRVCPIPVWNRWLYELYFL